MENNDLMNKRKKNDIDVDSVENKETKGSLGIL